tara:strand:+ start:323 stop:778 length:456 start_codon:yes stop_codon:yes gene_type:complete
MKPLILLILLNFLCSCEYGYQFEYSDVEYEFQIDGRTYLDSNGYYHLSIDPSPTQQTLHRFGAYITNIDKFGLPTQVIWSCDAFWSIDFFNSNANIPIINGTSIADPVLDSIFCMMAPIGAMVGDTIKIEGIAYFEEGDVSLHDSFHIIFN